VSADPPSYTEVESDDFSSEPTIVDQWTGTYNDVYYEDAMVKYKVKTFQDLNDCAWIELDNYSEMASCQYPIFGGYVEFVPSGAPVVSQGVSLFLSSGTTMNNNGNFGIFFDHEGPGNDKVCLAYYHSDTNLRFHSTNLTGAWSGEEFLCYWDGVHINYTGTITGDVSWDVLNGEGANLTDSGVNYRYLLMWGDKQSSGGTVAYYYGYYDNMTVGYISTNQPPNITLVSPENNNETLWYNNTYHNINFVWNVSDAENDSVDIHLYASEDNTTFDTLGIWNNTLNTTYMNWIEDTINGSLILPNTTYWWKICGIDRLGSNTWTNTSVWNFTTSNYTNLIPHYELISPDDGEVNITTQDTPLQIRVWDNDLGLYAPHPETDYLNVTFYDNDTGEIIGYYNALNNTIASVNWTGLNSTTLYHWYANISDWWSVNTTPVYTFYTGSVLPNGTIPFVYDITPYDGETLYYSKDNYVEMAFTVWDADSDYVDFYVYLFDDTWPYDEKRIRMGRLYNCDVNEGERYEWDCYGWNGDGFALNDTYYWMIGVYDSDGNSAKFPVNVGFVPDSYYSFNITYDPDGEDDPDKDIPDWLEDLKDSWMRWIVIALITGLFSLFGVMAFKNATITLFFGFFGIMTCWGLGFVYDVELFIVLVGFVVTFILMIARGDI